MSRSASKLIANHSMKDFSHRLVATFKEFSFNQKKKHNAHKFRRSAIKGSAAG